MGRPLRKDVNGVDVIRTFGTNTPGDENAGIRLSGYFGGALATDYMIIKQRGAKTFVVLSNNWFQYEKPMLYQAIIGFSMNNLCFIEQKLVFL